MYGGCALSMERSEVPPKAAADSRVGRAGGLALRAAVEVGGQRPALRLRAAPRTRSPLQCRALPLMRGAGSFTARLAPELRFGAAELGRRRISRPPDASVSRGGGVWERLRCGCRWHRECCGWRAAMRAAACLWAARAVPRCSAALGLRALGRFVDAGWQDSRAVHDSRGPRSEKCPFLAGSSRGVSSGGDLRGISDAWRAYPAKASSFRMHGVRILPRTGDFPVRGRFRDAWSEKIATD